MKKSNILSTLIALVMIFTIANFNTLSAQQSVEDQFWDAVKNSKVNDDLESYIKEYPKGKYVALARLKIKQNSREDTNKPPVTNGKTNFLITPNSVGDIILGMTIAEARKVFKNATFVQQDYSEEGTWVEVMQGGKELDIRFSTDQKRVDGDMDDNGMVPIVETANINRIEFSDNRYKTADRIGIGSTVADAEKIFGKIKKIEFWEYDASEHPEFTNDPKSYSFSISPKKGSANEARAGIYGKDEYYATRYNPGAYISSFKIYIPANNYIFPSSVAPKFEDYPAEEVYTGRTSPLIMDDFGKNFRTRLQNALLNGKPTFAGKYIVASWGCGSGGCNTGAIIDAKTGQAYPFPVSLSSVTLYNSEGEATDDFQDHEFKLNSRLMKFAGNLEGTDNSNGSDIIEYYEFKDGKFIFVKSMPYGKNPVKVTY